MVAVYVAGFIFLFVAPRYQKSIFFVPLWKKWKKWRGYSGVVVNGPMSDEKLPVTVLSTTTATHTLHQKKSRHSRPPKRAENSSPVPRIKQNKHGAEHEAVDVRFPAIVISRASFRGGFFPPTDNLHSDKKSSSTFQIRYRSQQDPLIHDQDASDFVFTAVNAPNQKVKNAHQLAASLGPESAAIRANEGEAAMYGIYYDDTAYDYMQHMREIGDSVEGVFIEAPEQKGKGKGKQQSLADALRETPAEELIPKELRASETLIKRTYQDQQDVPDALAGFQPDMDPRLREVLEALDDEAYVDDDEDIFEQLAEGGEATAREFEDMFFEEEEDENEGWESDATAKPGSHQKPAVVFATGTAATTEGPTGGKAAPVEAEAWIHEFSKFKKAEKRMKKPVDDASSMADTMSFGGSSLGGTMSMSGRTRRRHKKAGTESSGYSMTSSSLFRTEGLTTLDARFDKVADPLS